MRSNNRTCVYIHIIEVMRINGYLFDSTFTLKVMQTVMLIQSDIHITHIASKKDHNRNNKDKIITIILAIPTLRNLSI